MTDETTLDDAVTPDDPEVASGDGNGDQGDPTLPDDVRTDVPTAPQEDET